MGDDWMERIARARAENAHADQLRCDEKVGAEQRFAQAVPGFVSAVLAAVDSDVSRWNARSEGEDRIFLLEERDFYRCFLTGSRTLRVSYSFDTHVLDVDIAVGDGVFVAPNITATSYLLSVDGEQIVADRHGTNRRGQLASPAAISEEILTALLT
jgi:hypothetical protein